MFRDPIEGECRDGALTAPVKHDRTKADLERELRQKVRRPMPKRWRQHWNARHEEDLVLLFDAGLSFTRIAQRLQVSRNAVAGKLHRMGLKDKDRVCRK